MGFMNIREQNLSNESGNWERFLRGVIEYPCGYPSGQRPDQPKVTLKLVLLCVKTWNRWSSGIPSNPNYFIIFCT